MINWGGCERKPWWGNVPEFSFKDWGELREASVGITCAKAEV
jgi:hypothetical protein